MGHQKVSCLEDCNVLRGRPEDHMGNTHSLLNNRRGSQSEETRGSSLEMAGGFPFEMSKKFLNVLVRGDEVFIRGHSSLEKAMKSSLELCTSFFHNGPEDLPYVSPEALFNLDPWPFL